MKQNQFIAYIKMDASRCYNLAPNGLGFRNGTGEYTYYVMHETLTILYVQLSRLRTTPAITWSSLLLELRVDM